MVCFFMVCFEECLEVCVDFELQDVDGEWCVVDFVGVELVCGIVDVFVEVIVGVEDVVFGVGFVKVEGGIVEIVWQGIWLDVFVGGEDLLVVGVVYVQGVVQGELEYLGVCFVFDVVIGVEVVGDLCYIVGVFVYIVFVVVQVVYVVVGYLQFEVVGQFGILVEVQVEQVEF